MRTTLNLLQRSSEHLLILSFKTPHDFRYFESYYLSGSASCRGASKSATFQRTVYFVRLVHLVWMRPRRFGRRKPTHGAPATVCPGHCLRDMLASVSSASRSAGCFELGRRPRARTYKRRVLFVRSCPHARIILQAELSPFLVLGFWDKNSNRDMRGRHASSPELPPPDQYRGQYHGTSTTGRLQKV